MLGCRVASSRLMSGDIGSRDEVPTCFRVARDPLGTLHWLAAKPAGGAGCRHLSEGAWSIRVMRRPTPDLVKIKQWHRSKHPHQPQMLSKASVTSCGFQATGTKSTPAKIEEC